MTHSSPQTPQRGPVMLVSAVAVAVLTHGSIMLAWHEQGVWLLSPGLGLMVGLMLAYGRRRVALGGGLGLLVVSLAHLSAQAGLSPGSVVGLSVALTLLTVLEALWVASSLQTDPDFLTRWPAGLLRLVAVGTGISLIMVVLSTTALYGTGAYPAESWLLQVLLWWMRDIVSVAGVGALVLTVLSPRPHARPARRLGLLGTAMALLLSGFFAHQQDILQDQHWEVDASQAEGLIRRELHLLKTQIKATEALFAASQEVSAEEFRTFVSPFLSSSEPTAAFLLYRSATDPLPLVVSRDPDSPPDVGEHRPLSDAPGLHWTAQGGAWLLSSPVTHSRDQPGGMVALFVEERIFLDRLQAQLGPLNTAISLTPPTGLRGSGRQVVLPIGDGVWRIYLSPVQRADPFVLHLGSLVCLLGLGITNAISLLILHMSGQTEAIEQEVRDRTRELRLAKERAEAAASARTAFLANISHELRTPMNGVLGTVSLLEQHPHTLQQEKLLGIIREAGHSLLTLLNELLDLARIDSGRLELEEAPVALIPLLRESIALFEGQATSKDLRLRLEMDPLLPHHILADGLRLRQIVNNLLGNAVKFTEIGQVTVSAEQDAEVPDLWRLVVDDTGPGIPTAQIPHLFDRFVQADSSTTRRHGGSGLGLAIVSELVALMGGSVSVTSALGKGTRLTVRLPLRAANADLDNDATPPELSPTPLAETAGLRVLLVDDHPINRLLAQGMLEELGCTVREAEDGARAVAIWAEWQPDVVLMDCQMPILDGLEATRQIRAAEHSRGLPRTPVLALTANAFPSDVRACHEAGMDTHLSKPIRYETLRESLLRHPPAARRVVGSGATEG